MELALASEAEKTARDAVTHAAWGARLSLEQYQERERRLRGHPWARAAMRTWLLRDAGQVVGSLETFRMPSWVALPYGRAQGVTEGIASVYVEDRLRGRGYASELCRQVVGRARAEGAQALLLFSDVNPEIYARVGFVARPQRERHFAPLAGDPRQGVDAAFDERGLAGLLAEARPPGDRFVVWPSAEQLDWHLERERVYAALLGEPRPPVHCARAGAGHAFWVGDLKNRRLVLLLLATERADEAVALLRCARRAAHAAGLERVVLWEVPRPFAWPEGEGTPADRDDAIPMLCPLATQVRAEGWHCLGRALWI